MLSWRCGMMEMRPATPAGRPNEIETISPFFFLLILMKISKYFHLVFFMFFLDSRVARALSPSSLVTTTLQNSLDCLRSFVSCYSPKKSPCVSVSWKMLSFAVYTVYICHLQNDDSLCGNLETLHVRATSGVSYN